MSCQVRVKQEQAVCALSLHSPTSASAPALHHKENTEPDGPLVSPHEAAVSAGSGLFY